jgi:hypothetical protein
MLTVPSNFVIAAPLALDRSALSRRRPDAAA